jgi:hypothetical protein
MRASICLGTPDPARFRAGLTEVGGCVSANLEERFLGVRPTFPYGRGARPCADVASESMEPSPGLRLRGDRAAQGSPTYSMTRPPRSPGGKGNNLIFDYDSAGGHGPFGLGWPLSVPASRARKPLRHALITIEKTI